MNREDSLIFFQNTSLLKFNVCSRKDYSIFSKRKNHLNFIWELALKWIGRKKRFTKKLKSSSSLWKKTLQKIFAFNFMKEIPLKIKNWNRLQFYKRNPCKNYSDQKTTKSEIGSQKYPLGPWSLELFLRKSSHQRDFEKRLATRQLCWKHETQRKFVVHIFIYVYIYILLCLMYIP